MKRIGYIGLSTPSFYDYRSPAKAAPSDSWTSPNPIIEGAFGAMLLYDELWFLCRSLCPENMRSLPYVRFLDERGEVPPVDPEWLPEPSTIFQADALADFARSSAAYDTIKRQANVYWDAAADNHTHDLVVGDIHLRGNSWSVKNVIFDVLLVERLQKNVELITNSFTSRLFKSEASSGTRLKLTEGLILNSVPQFTSPQGPYDSCIEEVRESSYLSHFRNWIASDAFSATVTEVEEVRREVEEKLAAAQRDHFLAYLDPKGGYKSLAETMIGVGVDTLIPGAATVKDLMGQRNAEKKKHGMRWQGFILDAKQKVSRRKRS